MLMMIIGIRCYKHITLILRETLHWLMISQPSNCTHDVQLFSWLMSDVCTPVHTTAARSRLQSADHGDLIVPRMLSTRFGCHNLHTCGPTIWNELP